MHTLSPHSPARLAAAKALKAAPAPMPVRSARTARTVPDPLDMLAREIHGKVVHGTANALSHVAADELTLRRPRRPSARRAAYRTPPS